MAETDFAEKARLIIEILDKIDPIPKNAPREVQEAIDVERQVLVIRAGWNQMTVEKLRELLKK